LYRRSKPSPRMSCSPGRSPSSGPKIVCPQMMPNRSRAHLQPGWSNWNLQWRHSRQLTRHPPKPT
jgi:hypothetical protein